MSHSQRLLSRSLVVGAAILLLLGLSPAALLAQTRNPLPEQPPVSSPSPAGTTPVTIDAATHDAATHDAATHDAIGGGMSPAKPPEPEPTLWQEIEQSVLGGTFSLNLRLRAEIAEQSELDTSQAYTQRIRIGYGTKAFHGFSLFAELEDVHAANDHLYNAAGLNGEGEKTVIADPEASELNQYFAKYSNDYFTAIAGRQRIILDDQRFVGNVGWRQNEQTYDAYTISSDWVEDLRLFYSYVDDVNRIFGPEAHRDFESDSHLLNAAYAGCPFGTLTVFGYLLDFRNAPISSSSTVGARFTGERKLCEDFSLTYAASYAFQTDGRNNPDDYEAHYYAFEGTAGYRKAVKLGVGYEVLGSQGGRASFQTPLATLHAFNGWADVFLVTPPDGLEDLYFLASTAALPFDVQGTALYHLFFSEDRSTDFGGEFDALLSKKLTKNISLLGKLAVFHAESDRLPNHVQRYWVQAEVAF